MSRKHRLTGVLVFFAMVMLLSFSAGAADRITMRVGQKKKLYLRVKGKRIPAKKVKWTSSKKKVATINKYGKVTAKRIGRTTIRAKYKKITYKIIIVVKAKKAAVTTGTVNGSIQYFNNQYGTYYGDSGARVFLIPLAGNTDDFIVSDSLYFNYPDTSLNKGGIYYGICNTTGDYIIPDVPAGSYLVLVISENCSSSAWYSAYDPAISDVPDSYYWSMAEKASFAYYLHKTTAMSLAKSIVMHHYCTEGISVKAGGTTSVSEKFASTNM